jgi:hypothetical protein
MPPEQRKQCYLICDEASHIYNHQSTRLLVEARKLRLSFFSATQMLEQIPTEVKAAVNGNTSVKAAGWLQSSDANMMAREMRTTGQEIQDLNPLEWIFSTTDTKKAQKVFCPYGMLESLPKQKAAPQPPRMTPVEENLAKHLGNLYEDIKRDQASKTAEPAAAKQQMNENSLRDTDLPLPDDDPSKPRRGKWKE